MPVRSSLKKLLYGAEKKTGKKSHIGKQYRFYYVNNLGISNSENKKAKISVSVICLRGEFLLLPSSIVKIFISGGRLGTSF